MMMHKQRTVNSVVTTASSAIRSSPLKIFSGEYSRTMWEKINSAKTIADLRLALYTVCCRLQELEGRVKTQAPR